MFRIITISILVFISITNAQNRPESHRRDFGQKFDQLENIKLLEILNLDEETSIKFFTRRNKMKNKTNQLMKDHYDVVSNIEQLLNKDDEKKDYTKLVEKSLTLDKEISKVRGEFFDSLNDILSEEQIAKIIVFEFKFKRDLRDMLLERGRRKFNDNTPSIE